MIATHDIRVLVVEDNEDNRKILSYRLRRMGVHRIDEAENGIEALQVIATRCPNLVIMDMTMPVMDGFEAMRVIRAMPNGARTVPIIALTAACLDGDAQRCFAAGASDYLSKPIIDPEQLCQMIRAWLGKEHRPRSCAVVPADDTSAPRTGPFQHLSGR